MRGKVGVQEMGISLSRITPAYAGKRIRHPRPRLSGRDHPRLCGEKTAGEKSVAVRKGSPPPMRGKESIDGEDAGSVGITPAYAGKSHLEPS